MITAADRRRFHSYRFWIWWARAMIINVAALFFAYLHDGLGYTLTAGAVLLCLASAQAHAVLESQGCGPSCKASHRIGVDTGTGPE